MLELIKSPEDLKNLSYKELDALSSEIREKIIETAGANGGHLASNLGLVETTIALHRVFDTPRDAIVFDVGHQCYTHKLLTGRVENFSTLRQKGGISGFTNRDESEYDSFTEGHSGTSLSQALGLSCAFEKSGDDRYVVAVIGDGSFTNGMIYEALNSCKTLGRRLIIILNDNEMSISRNVGGMSSHLTKIRTSKRYFILKHRMKKQFSRTPVIGAALTNIARQAKNMARRVLVSDNLFECMGVDYLGPVDGEDLAKLEMILEEAKRKDVCTLVHIFTKKGKGHESAEKHPEKFHSVSAPPKGGEAKAQTNFSAVFGKTVEALTEKDSKVCAITAAMCDGTGLGDYFDKYPENSYDVGIAEEHAVTFSAGLQAGGAKPVTVLYSTFSQRVYDQIQHDVAIQNLPFTLCLDRAGLVEGDGITHQGIFDISMFAGIPGVNIYSPDSYTELENLICESVERDSIDIIRYPKGSQAEYNRDSFHSFGTHSIKCIGSASKKKLTFITYGRVTKQALDACEKLAEEYGVEIALIKLIKVFPIDFEPISLYASNSDFVYILEEGIKSGGVGEKIAAGLCQRGIGAKVKIHAVEEFVPHGSLSELFEKYGFTKDAICNDIINFAKLSPVENGGAENE